MSLSPPSSAIGGPVIGLDLGGTKIAAALFGADGTVLARHTRPTPALTVDPRDRDRVREALRGQLIATQRAA
ncbi:ROK family protein, partial [Streptomyces sp. NPDC002346]